MNASNGFGERCRNFHAWIDVGIQVQQGKINNNNHKTHSRQYCILDIKKG